MGIMVMMMTTTMMMVVVMMLIVILYVHRHHGLYCPQQINMRQHEFPHRSVFLNGRPGPRPTWDGVAHFSGSRIVYELFPE